MTGALAAVLVALGGRFVVVGSAAEALLGAQVVPRDLDVVPDPAWRPATVASLRAVAVGAFDATAPLARVDTAYGPVDLLNQRGDEEWSSLAGRATTVDVDGVPVLVAHPGDVTELRARFRHG